MCETLVTNILTATILFLSCNNDKKEIKSYSTIDTTLQQDIKQLLENKMSAIEFDWACAIVMEIKTGKIKALVNIANDNEDSIFKKLSFVPDFSTTKLILPGHIFTLASLMACVEDGYIDVDDIIVIEKRMHFLDLIIEDNYKIDKDSISIIDAFQLKSNTTIAKLVYNNYKDNPDKFIQRLNQFDIDKPLGITFKNEPNPIIKKSNLNNLSNVYLPMLSIGYQSKHTPLQLLVFYNSIVNNGKRIKPIIEKSDTLKLPIILNQRISSIVSISAGLKLLQNNQFYSDSINYHFWGHSTVISDFYEHNRKRSFQIINIGFHPEEKPKQSCIVVYQTKKNYLIKTGNNLIMSIFKYLDASNQK